MRFFLSRWTKGVFIVLSAFGMSATPQTTSAGQILPGEIGPDGAYQPGNGVTAPTALLRVAPALSDRASGVRASGEVLVSLVVRSDGSTRDMQVVRSAGYGMDENAIEAARKWKFKPGTKDGRPVDVRMRITLAMNVGRKAREWGAGPIRFDVEERGRAPVFKSGDMPKAEAGAENEAVVLGFLVDHDGKVSGVRPLEGEKSTSLPDLVRSVEGWRFSHEGAKPVAGSVLLIKGEDQFGYETSSAFRDSGDIRLQPQRVVPPVSPGVSPTPGRTVTVQVKLSIDPEEAKKQLIEGPPPEYPANAKRAGTQGTVLLGITIGVDGSVTDVRVIDGPPELTEAAVAAVRRWRYRPTMFRGNPRESVTTVEIRFQLP